MAAKKRKKTLVGNLYPGDGPVFARIIDEDGGTSSDSDICDTCDHTRGDHTRNEAIGTYCTEDDCDCEEFT
jgi:hypothetical protein